MTPAPARLYSAASEECLLARDFLKDWTGEGFLTQEQYKRLQQETVCDLRRTNAFLRLVLFLFTLIIVAASAALFFTVFLGGLLTQITGVYFLILAAISYAAAELAASQARLHRYGIEEALAVCSVGFLQAGLGSTFSSHRIYSPSTASLVPAGCAVLSLWIWRRFGLSYAFLAAMIFVLLLPSYWISSHSVQHLAVAVLYAIGLAGVAAVRGRHRFDYLNKGYSLVEAFLWLGIYLAFNLQLSSLNLLRPWWDGTRLDTQFAQPFYWATWVLIWCLPPAILARGVRLKDRLVIAAGAVAATLTFITNKPYLGWQRHTRDPMLLGLLLISVALILRRWLASGPSGIRHGFIAERLTSKDKRWMSSGSAIAGLVLPQAMAPVPQTYSPDVHFGGGDFGGGGASSDF